MSTSTAPQKHTPMMLQWHNCKKAAKDALLLFRMGDFYEAFHEDAEILAKDLDLTLTKRQGIPMSGIPQQTIESYVDRLIARGHRVAVAEQMEDPKQTKGIVKRAVQRIVTPGTVVNSSLLSDKSNNFFASVTQVGSIYALAYIDLTTSEFRVSEFQEKSALLNEIYRLRPSEFLTSLKFQSANQKLFDELKLSYDFLVNPIEDWKFDHQTAHDFLTAHFKVHNLDGFGLSGMVSGINAGGALLAYLQETLHLPIHHLKEIKTYSTTEFLSLDAITQRNLELTENLKDGGKKNTLFDALDQTCTPMGGRLLRHWVKQPLLSVEKIVCRQDAVEALLCSGHVLDELGSQMDHVRDLERLTMRIGANYANARDLVTLRFSLEKVPATKACLFDVSSELIQSLSSDLLDLSELTQHLSSALVEEPPLKLGEGKTFRPGFNPELDELTEISRNSKEWLARYQADLRESTGIKTLRVGYTRVFGYYIEVSKAQAANMPESFQRRQTLVNTERFISPELKDYESKVLSAEERISAMENQLFNELKEHVSTYTDSIRRIAQALAQIDCLCSLAKVARENAYTRPVIDESTTLDIKDGRHPIIEMINLGEVFIANDTHLNDSDQRLMVITGPNMAGKSTYLRQVTLIVILAQMGSFVPATSAHIGLVDKIFTRIGASDDLARGQSTFMVEMTETANIINNVTDRSLVILDEIGRGTSTYDGIAIAWSVAEHLLLAEGKQAKTLFATHYWELTKLEEQFSGAVNYNVAVQEAENEIIFLRKIVRGDTDKSYGIHVARLAGLPSPVISRAKEILVHLEENANRKETFSPKKKRRVVSKTVKSQGAEIQMSLFS